MSLYRGAGGASDATDDSTVNAVAGFAADAATSADNAAASASDANASAVAAAASASSSSSSASSVSINATNAANSASLASTYAGQASSSKDAAAASAVIAADKAGLASADAANSFSNAATSTTKASEAAESALVAEVFASVSAASAADALAIYGNTEDMEAAVASASDAAVSANADAAAAAASAVDAAESEALAFDHEQNAAEWATISQGAANNSQAYSAASAAARDAALAALDNFDDRYLGQKDADPLVDNDGNTLIAGALYFNNQDNVMKVYEGSIWVSAYASLSGALLAANNLNDLNSASISRTNLGLGTAAVTDSTAYATAAQGASADTAFGWGDHASGGYAADNAVVKLTGNQTVAGIKTLSSNPILSGGTADSIAYLNSSKVLTTSSSFNYNGSSTVSLVDANPRIILLNGTDGISRTEYSNLSGTFYVGAENSAGSSFSTTPYARVLWGTGNYPIVFGVDSLERMRLTSTGLDVTGTATVSGAVTLSSGTANGVAYLNGSKVLTTGSALTFDGTTRFLVNGVRLDIDGGTSADQLRLGTDPNYYKIGRNSGSGPLEFYGTQSGVVSYVFGGVNGEYMRLTSTGLGIGTSSPDSKFVVQGSSGTYAQIKDGTVNTFIQARSADSAGVIGTLTNHALQFWTNSSFKATLDTAGNLGLGVTPSAWGQGRAIELLNNGYGIWNGTDSIYSIANAYFNSGFKYANTGQAASHYYQFQGAHVWSTAPSGTAGNAISFTQALTLDSSGFLFLGCTTTPSASVKGIRLTPDFTTNTPKFSTGSATSLVYMIEWINGNGIVGSISTNGSATAYNTSSDYRLKNITGPITTSGAYIDSLNPVEGTWKADNSTFVGLIAHEVQEASRTNVATGVKDGEEMQGMDYSSAEIIANLIAEVKSLRQRLAAAGI